ncbi:MAG TPA: hypothetical protein QF630_04595 [Alphaproteobacteria bacterium]|nr:hypothetical protein [Alphaproteobacteria bacterium]
MTVDLPVSDLSSLAKTTGWWLGWRIPVQIESQGRLKQSKAGAAVERAGSIGDYNQAIIAGRAGRTVSDPAWPTDSGACGITAFAVVAGRRARARNIGDIAA